MQKNWTGKNIDLALFATRLGDFFKEWDFEAIKGGTSNGYLILAQKSPCFKIDGYVSVAIEGNPNDLVVKFDLCEKEGKSSLKSGIILETMLIGGYLLSRKLKSEEDWLRLEREFWRHVDNILPSLTNSAKSSPSPSE